MALYELGKAHFAINSDGTFRYLGRLIKKDWYNISSKQWTFKYQFSKKDGIITDTVVVNYIPGTFKELEPKVIYTAEEKVAYEKEKRGIKGMAKFKVGDRVKLNPFKFTAFCDKIGTIKLIWIDKFGNYSYNVDFKDTNLMANNVEEKWIELVEPKEDKPSKVVYDYRGHDDMRDLIKGMLGAIIIVDQKDYCDSELRNHARSRNIDLVMYVDRRKETLNQDPFKLNPHEFDETKTPFSDSLDSIGYILKQIEKPFAPFPYYHFSLDDDALDAIKYALPPSVDYQRRILGIHTKPQPPKNRIPDRVVFNQEKGKVTVLISKHLDGVAPYWAYTSKVHGDDEYNGYFGFMLSYYKYLNRHLGGDTRKELIDMAFQHGDNAVYIIEGAVSQEVMKIVKIDEWNDILDAIMETSSQNKGYWDYAEWKEMLRVHELETKREEQKAIRKEIKKHEQEIEKLKKKGV